MLDYVALGILIFAFVTVFYGIIVIHDIPYEIAVHRNHPHQDAIHYAGWISLFTIGAIWPFLWIWATLYREDRGWGMDKGDTRGESGGGPVAGDSSVVTDESLQAQLDINTERLERLELSRELPSVKNDIIEADEGAST
jgi:hypothetical protein